MKKFLLSLAILLFIGGAFAQNNNIFEPYYMSDALFGYNFFVGDDAKDFATVPKRLGSGLYDFSFNYSLLGVWILNPKNSPIGFSAPLGLRVAKYRFLDNLSFDKNSGTPQIKIDNEPTHNYNPYYHSRDGSKLVTGYWRVPVFLYFPIQKWLGGKDDFYGIFGTFFYERYAFTYHKLRYKIDGNTQKIFSGNKQMKDFGFSKDKIGVSGGIKLKFISLYAQYVITPFFNESVGKNINEMRVGIRFVPVSKRSNNATPFDGFESK